MKTKTRGSALASVSNQNFSGNWRNIFVYVAYRPMQVQHVNRQLRLHTTTHRGMDREQTHHRHALDGFLFPIRKWRVKRDVVVLQHTQAERVQRVVRFERPPIRKLHKDSGL